jgi:hypothetical protein
MAAMRPPKALLAMAGRAAMKPPVTTLHLRHSRDGNSNKDIVKIQ